VRCERLDVWKRSARLSVEVYKHFADCKDFGFKDQITRSSLSIPSNILEIAKGSSAELITQVYIGIEIGLSWKKEIEEILKMIVRLQQKVGLQF
jgi:hypothetical protein